MSPTQGLSESELFSWLQIPSQLYFRRSATSGALFGEKKLQVVLTGALAAICWPALVLNFKPVHYKSRCPCKCAISTCMQNSLARTAQLRCLRLSLPKVLTVGRGHHNFTESAAVLQPVCTHLLLLRKLPVIRNCEVSMRRHHHWRDRQCAFHHLPGPAA